jgi:hypothetical protein
MQFQRQARLLLRLSVLCPHRRDACRAVPAAGLETHLSVTDVGGLILAVIAFNLAAALTPTKGTFVPDEEELAQRPAGALQVL